MVFERIVKLAKRSEGGVVTKSDLGSLHLGSTHGLNKGAYYKVVGRIEALNAIQIASYSGEVEGIYDSRLFEAVESNGELAQLVNHHSGGYGINGTAPVYRRGTKKYLTVGETYYILSEDTTYGTVRIADMTGEYLGVYDISCFERV